MMFTVSVVRVASVGAGRVGWSAEAKGGATSSGAANSETDGIDVDDVAGIPKLRVVT
jgi:hypothetical protein